MRLKSLDIYGFKSFADRTHIEFSDGVTCLVGPNGCGKSNIVEAFTWVLGTQAASVLRSSSMGDVVFKGTRDADNKLIRRDMEEAEVSLTIIQDDGNDVKITRHIEKKGPEDWETTYLINNRESRLKDINSIFFNTGLGKNSYSIFMQDRINLILAVNPSDRRYIFEEVAGISQFKQDENEAASRLASAEENLKSVTSEFNSVHKNYERLKEQSSKVAEYRKNAAALKELEKKECLIEVVSMEKGMENLRKSIERDKEKLKKIQEQAEKVLQERQKREEQLKVLREEKNKLEMEKIRLDEAVRSKTSSRTYFEEIYNQQENNSKGFKARIAEIDKETSEKKAELKSLLADEEKLKTDFQKLEKTIKDATDKKNGLEEQEKKLNEIFYSSAENEKAIQNSLSLLYKDFVTLSHKIIKNVYDYIDSGKLSEKNEAEKELTDIFSRKEKADIDKISELFDKYRKAFPAFLEKFSSDEKETERLRKQDELIQAEIEKQKKMQTESDEAKKQLYKTESAKNDLYLLLEEKNREHSSVGQKLSELKIKLGIIKNEIDSINKRKESAEADFKGNDERLKSFKEKIDTLDAEIKKSQSESERLAKQAEAIMQKIQKMENAAMKEDESRANEAAALHDNIVGYGVKIESIEEVIKRKKDEFFEENGVQLDDVRSEIRIADKDREQEIRAKVNEMRKLVRGYGQINYLAEEEFKETEVQHKLISSQLEDYTKAREDLKVVLDEIRSRSRDVFVDTFTKINDAFAETFSRLFPGGRAYLEFEGDDPLTCGIEIFAQPAGKPLVPLQSLSGGEKSMTTAAFIFALYKIKPSPFCILDEFDAALDDRNVGGFLETMNDFKDKVQFIIITHNRHTLLSANYLIGVTQVEQGVSKVLSYNIDNSGKDFTVRDAYGHEVDLQLE